MEKLYFATGNKKKVKEAQAILQVPIEIADIEVDEVQSMDLSFVAKRKAEAAFEILKKPLIVDDVGLKIAAWNGFPGPLVKHLLNSLGNKGLLKVMENETNRNVTVQNVIAFHDGEEVHTFLGEFSGRLATEEKGEDGWGFDFIIIPEGQELTMAEMGFDAKNKMSHRKLSLDKAKEYLDSKNA